MPGSDSNIELHILSTLEEAGEENVVAVAKSWDASGKRAVEAVSLARAIGKLLQTGWIQIAEVRDHASLRWRAVAEDVAEQICDRLPTSVRWSAAEAMWVWTSPAPIPHLLVTKAGLVETRRLLDDRG